MVEESLTGKVTSEQEFIMARHSRMGGRVLDLVEASLPEGNQCDKLKKLIQVPLYEYRNDILRFFYNIPETNDD